ncbi:endo-1,4-beta-xylanase [Streptomyces sp. 4N509B]|uniref:endo-1,4-beta-xylanase n=1 Tax=Streptomyces sp. 4N509B TaxID=3457413 RepID=UPI003FD2D965
MVTTSPHNRKHARKRPLLRSALALGLAGAMATAGVVALSGSASAQSSLGSAAAAKGRFFGVAANENYFNESAYTSTMTREFNSLTAENSMKWDTVEPNQGQFNWGPGDRIAQQARNMGVQYRGHTLVWHSQLPGWVNSGNARQAMTNHINAVLQHWPDAAYWDVVNEAFEENGSRRNSPFQQAMGDGFIAEAFRIARQADPDTKLCYNDYNLENPGPKQDAAYNLVRDLKAQGLIDCIGFQGHFNSGNPVPQNFHQTLQRFADLGVDVEITELDIAGSGSSQAEQYQGVTQACLAVERCVGITVWGVTDKYSWRAQDTPLLFDGNYQAKQAYTAVLNVLTSGLVNLEDQGILATDRLAAIRPEDVLTGVPADAAQFSRVASAAAGAGAIST